MTVRLDVFVVLDFIFSTPSGAYNPNFFVSNGDDDCPKLGIHRADSQPAIFRRVMARRSNDFTIPYFLNFLKINPVLGEVECALCRIVFKFHS